MGDRFLRKPGSSHKREGYFKPEKIQFSRALSEVLRGRRIHIGEPTVGRKRGPNENM